ncbi:MAG: hypothetical protein JWR44_1724 [Hymenobacter sp.]|jgi:hypothetical protein|nr:hypothetical protein [Hymenobacter sp.]
MGRRSPAAGYWGKRTTVAEPACRPRYAKHGRAVRSGFLTYGRCFALKAGEPAG